MPGDSLSARTGAAPAPASSSTRGASGDYLSGFSGVDKSTSYGFSADASTKAPVMPGDYLSAMTGSAPAAASSSKPAASGDYLSGFSGLDKSTSYGFSADASTAAPVMRRGNV